MNLGPSSSFLLERDTHTCNKMEGKKGRLPLAGRRPIWQGVYLMRALKNKKVKRVIVGFATIFAIVVMISSVHAGSFEPEEVLKGYKSAVKSCKQIEREHENMKGQHELMFKAWKDKSEPLLTESGELNTKCHDAIQSLKEISGEVEKSSHDSLSYGEDKLTSLSEKYEKAQSLIKNIIIQHRDLREEHEKFFHEMMGH